VTTTEYCGVKAKNSKYPRYASFGELPGKTGNRAAQSLLGLLRE